MDNGSCCLVCYSSNPIGSEFRHLKQDTHIMKGRNRNYEARFGMNGDNRRQTL